MLDIKIYKYNKMSNKKISSVIKKLINKNSEVHDRIGDIEYYDSGNTLNLIRFKKNNTVDKTLIEKKKVIEGKKTIFDEIRYIKLKSKF